MTKYKSILIARAAAILFALVALFFAIALTFTAARPTQSAALDAEEQSAAFEAQQMRDELRKYLDGRTDRTPFSDGEKEAANYLLGEMSALDGFESELQEIAYRPYSDNSETVYYSQNVVSVRKSKTPDAKTVIIGANYDNQYGEFALPQASRYSSPQVLLNATRSSGAYLNGTGTAALLSLARKIALDGKDLGFDLYVVFFGCGELGSYGARTFVDGYMTTSLLPRTVLMINLQRLGGDKTYIYSDEVRTDQQDYFTDRAAKTGMTLSTVPETLPRMAAEYIDGLNFTHVGMLGGQAEFMKRGIPCANIFGGTFDTFSFGLEETSGAHTIAYTENDNIDYLEKNLSGYADKMAETADLIYGAFADPEFISSIENSRSTKEDYSLLTKAWIPSVIAIGVLLLCALALIPISVHFEKKYPPKPKVVRRLKVAVFGMDYESPSEGDIFVDVRRKGEGNGSDSSNNGSNNDDPQSPFGF